MFVLLAADIFTMSFKENESLKKYLVCLITIILLFLFSIYYRVYTVDNKRIEYINANANVNELVLPNLPFTEYMQAPNPKSGVFKKRFKLFYGINKDTNIEFVSYKEWAKEVKE